VCENDVVAAVTRLVNTNSSLPLDICQDAARYLSNVCRPLSKDYMHRLVEEAVPTTILKLMQMAKSDSTVQLVTVRGLQNLLFYKDNCMELCRLCFMPLLKMVREFKDAGSALSLFNISCVVECEPWMHKEQVHMRVLESFSSAPESSTKCIFLWVRY
jgi:hypothetical protein